MVMLRGCPVVCIRWSRAFLALVLLAASAGCAPAPSPAGGGLQGTITVSGAFALYPLMVRWSEEYHTANPGVEFDISAGGAGKGMADALSGAVDIGMVSRDIAPEEEAKGAFWLAVTKDAVFPTVSAANPVLADLMARGLSRETLAGIYMTGEITTWGQVVGRADLTDEIHVYTRSDACGAADAWSKYVDGKQEDLLGIGVYGDPGVVDAVAKDPLGLGYNNLNYAYDPTTGQPMAGVVVAPIDADGNGRADSGEVMGSKADALEAVASGRYPSPPARVLNLVTRGKPQGVVRDFVLWVLSEGQQFVGEVGYVALPADMLAAQESKLR